MPKSRKPKVNAIVGQITMFNAGLGPAPSHEDVEHCLSVAVDANKRLTMQVFLGLLSGPEADVTDGLAPSVPNILAGITVKAPTPEPEADPFSEAEIRKAAHAIVNTKLEELGGATVGNKIALDKAVKLATGDPKATALSVTKAHIAAGA